MDSISFARGLVDGYKGSFRHWLYTTTEKPDDANKALGTEHAIRKGSLKLISLQEKVNDTFHRRLYDLSTDLKEEHNLIVDDSYKDDVTEMLQRLIMYVGPTPRPDAPFCNLEYCGSTQAWVDEKLQKYTFQVAKAFQCYEQRTTTSTSRMVRKINMLV